MTTRIGTIDSTVEVVPEEGTGAVASSDEDETMGEEQRFRMRLTRIRLLAMRTRAEGFDD